MAQEFTRKDAQQLIGELASMEAELRQMLQTLQKYEPQLIEVANSTVEKEFEALLDRSSIDVLGHRLHDGIMESLKESGVTSLTELKNARRVGAGSIQVRRALNNPSVEEAMKEVERLAHYRFQIRVNPRSRKGELDSLVLALWQAHIADEQIKDCRDLLGLKADIDRSAGLVNEGTRFFKRIFSSEAQKQTVREAYERLRSLAQGDYGTRVKALRRKVLELEYKHASASWNAFIKNPTPYFNRLGKVAPGRFCGGPLKSAVPALPYDVGRACRIVADFDQAFSHLQTALEAADGETLREKVKSCAYDMVKREVMQQLRQIPVKELNRGGKGYRVSALQAAGFDNLATIAAAGVYNLSSIHGVGVKTAKSIKRDCATYAEQLAPGVRIKLSADNRTDEATQLVASAYAIISSSSAFSQCKQQGKKASGSIKSARDNLVSGGYDDLAWLVWDGLRQKKSQAFSTLSSAQKHFATWNKSATALEKSLAITPAEAWSAFKTSPFEFYNLLEEVVPELMGGSGAYGLPEELAREVEGQAFFPEGLLCTLRRYQEYGVKYALHQERVLLGDEMGLGKTVQAIATMVSLRNTGETHFMVVCPASVLVNWCREVAEKSKLRVTKIHGRDAKSALESWVKTGGVAVTTFETTSRVEVPMGLGIGLIVVDEAHYVKNPNARRSVSTRNLCRKARRVLFMTGTALENKVDEMIELMRVLQPEVARRAESMASLSNAPAFRDAVAPVYYRRKRDDVLSEMPELVESKEWCALSGRVEKAAYEDAVLDRNFMRSRRVSWNVNNLKTQSSKAKRLLEIVADARDDGRKVIVFSYFRDTLASVRGLLGKRASQPINGSVPPAKRQEILDEFAQAPAGSVLVAQIQSGGTGLNIQSASVVVICEPQLKPSIENQAISRAYRMGQTRNVLVYRLLCENTIDERITNILAEKQRAFDMFADESSAAAEMIELDKAAQNNIIEQEIERINARKGT